MFENYQSTTLWQHAFSKKNDGLDKQRDLLVQAYESFRERVALLLAQIRCELPDLTLHDISHVDALWRVASEIAGPDYPLNPAEALVLGGAFLLHDAAHCRAAYAGGLAEIRQTAEFRDAAAQRGLQSDTLEEKSADFQAVLFDTLRLLHPRQAKKLAFTQWDNKHLFPHDELREAYGHLMGEIAESHWAHPHELERFAHTPVAAPVYLTPANWIISPLKLAVLLRVADAAHIDARRAPRLLLAMSQPKGISKEHWRFQARIFQPTCDPVRETLLFSGNPFPADEQAAWWLAYDAACLVDKELTAADQLLRDHHLPRLAAKEVVGIRSPERFAKGVPTQGWHPVDASLRISNIQSVVEQFGGQKLYGNKPELALRELLQNARDAIHAARHLGYLNEDEGEIEVAQEDVAGGHWLHVTDTGIGMSRYVLTQVLLDFGRSLWRSPDLRGEWSGLAASGFEAVGQFGIGFFSVFMLGQQVKVCTRRCESMDGEPNQWLLEFQSGTQQRPILREPNATEKLKKAGTRVSVFLSGEKLDALVVRGPWRGEERRWLLAQLCAYLAPALDIHLYVREATAPRTRVVSANDWQTMPALALLQRIAPFSYDQADKSKFGLWSHLTALRNAQGQLIGRCAIPHPPWSGWGVGISGGLRAGDINGLEGIAVCHPQTDLARASAIPMFSLTELQQWAEEQKERLIQAAQPNEDFSHYLISYGAEYTDLLVGRIGGEPYIHHELVEYFEETEQVIIHSGHISYDSSDDVLERIFDELEVSDGVFEYKDRDILPNWLDSKLEQTSAGLTWSLKAALVSALKTAWGEVEWDTEEVVVGTVDGTEIVRDCEIARRGSGMEDDQS